MQVVTLSREEANRKLQYLAVKLWREQYDVNWLIQDLRPEVVLKNELVAFWEGRVAEIHGWTDVVGQLVGAVVTPVRNALQWFWDNVFSPGIKGLLDGLGWIAESARNLILQALEAAAGAGGWLWNAVKDATSGIWDALQNVWNYLVEKVSGALEALSKGLAALPEAIAAAFQSAVSWIGQLISGVGTAALNFFTWLQKSVVEPVYKALTGFFTWIAETVLSYFVSTVSSFLKVSRRILKGDWTAALEVLTPMVLGGLSVNAILSVAGIKVLGSGVEVEALAKYLNRLLSPELLSAAFLGTVIYVAIRRPLEQAFNRMFRNAIPPRSDLELMFRRGLISEGEYVDFMQREGWPDSVIRGYLDMANVIPGIGDLITFAVREAYPVEGPEAQLAEMRKWAAKQGLSSYWAERYWIAHWRLPDFSSYREAFWRGIIDKDQYFRAILRHDYRPDPWRAGEKPDQQIMFELSYELPGAIEQRWMLRWGLIDYETLKDLTAKRGVHPDWVERVAQAIERQMLTDERTRLLGQLRRDYLDGALTREALASKLKALFYSDAEIALILEAADLERAREARKSALIDYREASRADFSRAFKLGLISEAEYRKALAALRYPAEVVDMLVAIDSEVKALEAEREKKRLEAELRRQNRELTRADLSRAFKLGVINESVYRERLKTLGYSSEEIDTIVAVDEAYMQSEREREALRKKEWEAREAARLTLDERNSVRSALTSLFIHGLLSEEALRARLAKLGFSADENALTVEAAILKQHAALTDKRIDAAVMEYRYGKITLEQLSQKLSELGLSTAFVQNILEFERARTKTPVASTPEEEVRAYGASVAIARYVDGLTTAVELEQELKLLGYTQAQIAVYKVYVDLKRDYEVFKDVLNAVRTAYRKGKIGDAAFLSTLAAVGVPEATRYALLNLEKTRLGYGLEAVT